MDSALCATNMPDTHSLYICLKHVGAGLTVLMNVILQVLPTLNFVECSKREGSVCGNIILVAVLSFLLLHSNCAHSKYLVEIVEMFDRDCFDHS